MWIDYINAQNIEEVLQVLAEQQGKARIVAGGTDLILEMERGVRKGITTLVDVTRIPGLDQITLDEDDNIHLGPMVTHNHCVSSKLIVERAFPLARAAWEVGAPQIRNRGTVAGNLITASPANDTISPLIAMGAYVTLASHSKKRNVPLDEFYTGVRGTVMRPDEMLVDIVFPALDQNTRGTFFKLGLRRAQAISLVNAAILLTIRAGQVKKASITLGSVAPTIIHATLAEEYLVGKNLQDETIEAAARLAQKAARPISDVRSPADYRSEMVRVCALRGLRSIQNSNEREDYPAYPILLRGRNFRDKKLEVESATHHPEKPIVTRINGRQYTFHTGHEKTLLRLLREEAGLTGTKEGCAEGECGACTVFLDGEAVMSCLVAAPRAHGAEIITVEGLAQGADLHPVQQAFIDEGAVQCGYCTPGFLMSAAMLLDEKVNPDMDDIRQAITGNLCRCTGYYSIVSAIEKAALEMGKKQAGREASYVEI